MAAAFTRAQTGRAASCSSAARPRRGVVRVKAVAATTAKKDTAAPASNSKAPSVAPEVAKELYYDMVLGREFEEMCAQMYYRGKMFGFVHLYSGQEAVSTGKFLSHNKECARGLTM
eukprot:GHRR01012097.1.p1 GENE.GHRR01012097.1~~GHRR01012097.1.p1  ORF type:complete len:116 (+),score=35.81 GHRR01012097.1:347-694(+)